MVQQNFLAQWYKHILKRLKTVQHVKWDFFYRLSGLNFIRELIPITT